MSKERSAQLLLRSHLQREGDISHRAKGAIPQQMFTHLSQSCLSLCGHVLKQNIQGEKTDPVTSE